MFRTVLVCGVALATGCVGGDAPDPTTETLTMEITLDGPPEPPQAVLDAHVGADHVFAVTHLFDEEYTLDYLIEADTIGFRVQHVVTGDSLSFETAGSGWLITLDRAGLTRTYSSSDDIDDVDLRNDKVAYSLFLLAQSIEDLESLPAPTAVSGSSGDVAGQRHALEPIVTAAIIAGTAAVIGTVVTACDGMENECVSGKYLCPNGKTYYSDCICTQNGCWDCFPNTCQNECFNNDHLCPSFRDSEETTETMPR